MARIRPSLSPTEDPDDGNARLALAVLLAVVARASRGHAEAQQSTMTFFVTSSGPGRGADLGGRLGADAHARIAKMRRFGLILVFGAPLPWRGSAALPTSSVGLLSGPLRGPGEASLKRGVAVD